MKRGMMIILAALLSTPLGAADPGVEFSGVLTTDGKTKIALTTKATGVTRWVDPGEDFNGFVVSRFDARDEAVTLTRAGQDFRLPLVAPKEPVAPAATASRAVAATPPQPPAAAAVRGTPSAGSSKVQPPPPADVLAPEPPGAPTGRAATASPAPSNGTAAGTAPAPSSGDAAVTRSVQPGETVESIARAAGLTPQQLQSLNPNLNAGSLQPGQVVRIR